MQRLRTGDEVIVISGDDKGRRGRITKMLVERNAVVVGGLNMVKRHVKATPQRPGGILEVEAPINISKVMPVDPGTGKATRVKYKVTEGKKQRVAKSGAVIVHQEQG